MKNLLLIFGLILILLSFYLYATSYEYGSRFNSWDMKCGNSVFIKSNFIHLITSWFRVGLTFDDYNLCNSKISTNFPYLYWLGWLMSLFGMTFYFKDKRYN